MGFPGETEEDFQATLDLVREIGYMQLFTFIYSRREGTKAATMPDPITRKEKTDRMARLLALHDEISHKLVSELVGSTVTVLVESHGRNRRLPERPSGQQAWWWNLPPTRRCWGSMPALP